MVINHQHCLNEVIFTLRYIIEKRNTIRYTNYQNWYNSCYYMIIIRDYKLSLISGYHHYYI